MRQSQVDTVLNNPLGVIAGRGDLPRRVIAAAQQRQRDVFVVAIRGQTDKATVSGLPHVWLRLGQGGAALEMLRQAGVRDLVMMGGIHRPSLVSLRPDLRTVRFLAGIGRRALGDDGLLRAITVELEKEGFHILAVEEILDDILASSGIYGLYAPDEADWIDIRRGLEVARGLGGLDVGQAVVVQRGLVLGVEAIEGTDKLVARSGRLKRSGGGGVLVKIRKPGQDDRLDLPTIGPRTIRSVAAAGLRGIAVESGGALVVDRDAVIRMADSRGVFVIGIDPDDSAALDMSERHTGDLADDPARLIRG